MPGTPWTEATSFLVAVSQTISWPGHAAVKFPVDAFSRKCLLQGVDELGYLQSFEKQVVEYERKRA